MRQTDKEYAEALFAIASEEGILSECLEDIRTVKDAFSQYPEYIDLLASPAIPLSERLSAVDEAFSSGIHEYVLYFLKLLCEKGRARLFFEAAEEFETLCLAHSGSKNVYITSATELSEEQKATLSKKLEMLSKKKVEPIYCVDKTLIGGLKIEIDGKVYDGTLKSRLRSVKDVMMDEQTQ